MNILHATTDPPLLQRLKEMPGSLARADIAVGYFFDRLRASFFFGFAQAVGPVKDRLNKAKSV